MAGWTITPDNNLIARDEKQSTSDSSNTTISTISQDNQLANEAIAHAHELIQPHNSDGSPNQDFIDYYPESAKDYGFIPKENAPSTTVEEASELDETS
nr:MAG TPA: hypothetical protein [Caudoviricetes sp.]